MVFADEEFHLHGDSKDRDEQYDKFPENIQKYVRRPDVGVSPDQIDILLGCPTIVEHEETPFKARVSQKIDKTIERLEMLCEMRDAILEDQALEYGENSPGWLLFASLAFVRRSFDHWLKNIPWKHLETDLLRFDAAMDKYTRGALKLHEHYTNKASVDLLHLNAGGGGASLRPTFRIARAARLSALSAVFERVHELLGITTPDDVKNSPLRGYLFEEANEVILEHDNQVHRHSQAFPNAGLPDATPEDLPAVTHFKHTDVASTIRTKILGSVDAGMWPTRIKQGVIVRAKDWYDAQFQFKNPSTDHLPKQWSQESKDNFARTCFVDRIAKNGSSLWLLCNNRKNVKNNQRIRLKLSELEFLVAARIVLGLGFKGLSIRPDDKFKKCSCHRKTELESDCDQHLAYGCPEGSGDRATRHKDINNVLYNLAKESDFHTHKESCVTVKDITAVDKQKYMDLIIQHPDSDKTLHLDVSAVCPVSKTAQERAGGPKAIVRKCFDKRVQEKADTYAAECKARKALLVPFLCSHTGGLEPVNPVFDARQKLNPRDRLTHMFKQGIPPARGYTQVSIEAGVVQKLCRSITQENHQGRGAFDATLQDSSAAGMYVNQTMAFISYYAIRGTARAAIRAMQQHQEKAAWWSTNQ